MKNNDRKINLEKLKNAARNGDHESQYKLAMFYRDGKILVRNLPLYKKLLNESAKNGSGKAAFLLGNCYSSGFCVDVNESASLTWYRLAIKRGNIDAHYKMALILLAGIPDFSATSDLGILDSVDEAEALLRYAATRSHREAQYHLGLMYNSGAKGIGVDFAEFERWLHESAKLDFIDAQVSLAYLYTSGSIDGIVKPNVEKALHWWTKASEQGNNEAQYNLGVYHSREAIRYWDKASLSGNKKARYMLDLIPSFEWDK